MNIKVRSSSSFANIAGPGHSWAGHTFLLLRLLPILPSAGLEQAKFDDGSLKFRVAGANEDRTDRSIGSGTHLRHLSQRPSSSCILRIDQEDDVTNSEIALRLAPFGTCNQVRRELFHPSLPKLIHESIDHSPLLPSKQITSVEQIRCHIRIGTAEKKMKRCQRLRISWIDTQMRQWSIVEQI